ncbi:hypothetical protein BDV25DRAFT_146489 [Aspergillus avenaceus]|uniref:BZIP domain-containing protein n=1 Tax=Aspergillus avenaceus TaxID=36643 RepID=A0A5N6UAT2_ASPAV|nr:hypothetical protein BDV25DRAFT_146489 [Aspergillus avenaceus]
MSSTRYNASTTSNERKRLRDRRAQKNLRDKRENRIRALEERVAHCDRHHHTELSRPREDQNAVDCLRRENGILVARQERLYRIIQELQGQNSGMLDTRAMSTIPIHPYSILPISSNNFPIPRSLTEPRRPSIASMLNKDGNQTSDSSAVGTTSLAGSPSYTVSSTPSPYQTTIVRIAGPPRNFSPHRVVPMNVPPWCLLPYIEFTTVPAIHQPHAWLHYPEAINVCPPFPSPLDLLHGTKRNFLADSINRGLRRYNLRDPECLANGYLIYVVDKWRVSPNPTTYSRLPPFMRPVRAQLEYGHPVVIEYLVWPQLRRNLATLWANYDIVELVDYLACCIKVRWPWFEDILERDHNDHLQISRRFFETFTRTSGWGITSEFIDKYPELLEGLDVESIRYRMDIP